MDDIRIWMMCKIMKNIKLAENTSSDLTPVYSELFLNATAFMQ